MLTQMQSARRTSDSSSDEQALVPMSPNSAALLEQDIQNINEQTQTLLADKVAAEQRCAELLASYSSCRLVNSVLTEAIVQLIHFMYLAIFNENKYCLFLDRHLVQMYQLQC